MGLFTDLVAPAVGATYAPWDDFWYQKTPPWSTTESGYPVSPEASMRLGAVFGCIALISGLVGTLPLILYRRTDDDGKDRATTHPLYSLLRRRPNGWQTAKEWFTIGTQYLLNRGNFYNEIKLDGRGAIAQLIPLHPDRMKVTLLDSGRRGYLYRPNGKPDKAFTQDEIHHVMGFSLDGIKGCSLIEFARESIGTAQMQEGFAGRFWAQGAELGGVLTVPGQLNDTTRAAMRASWQESHSGLSGAHKIALLEGGTTFAPVAVKGRDAQYIESRNFSVIDIARFFNVSPYWLGVEGQWATGTGIEQLLIQLVKVTLMPWLTFWEQAIFRDLLDDENYFTEFLIDALLRGDTATRFQAYAVAVMNGIMSENEVRLKENLNPWPGLWEPKRSVNQGRGGNPTTSQPGAPSQRPAAPAPPADDEPAPEDARARLVIEQAAARLVRKEIAAVSTWSPRYASDAAGWRTWVAKFYEKHQATLVNGLSIGAELARRYVADHQTALLAHGVGVLEQWERDAPAALAALALTEAVHA